MPRAVPHSKSIMEEFLPERVKARAVTKNPAKRAPAKAQKLTGEIKAKIPLERACDIDKVVAVTATDFAAMMELAVTAPKVAPEEMPIIPGSASGFLKKSWKTAPLPPRRMPVNKTKSARGRRSCQIMIWANLSSLEKLTFSAPKQSAIKKLAKRMIIERTVTNGIFI